MLDFMRFSGFIENHRKIERKFVHMSLWHKHGKRVVSFVLMAVLLLGLLPALPISAKAATRGLTMEELMAKFPHGKYWNGGNADSWTETPCTHHGSCSYTGSCGCNSFMGQSIQCYGFAEKLGYDATTYSPRVNANGWYKYTNVSALNNLKPGDIVRIDSASGWGHSIYVTEVDGDKVTYADCNSRNRSCNIRWGTTTTKSYLSSIFQWVQSAPFPLTTGFLAGCERYASSGMVSIVNDTILRTLPCTQETQEDSVEVYNQPAGTELPVIGLYKNPDGAYWYKTTYQGEDCYLFAGDTDNFRSVENTITITDVRAPLNTRKGYSYSIKGQITSSDLNLMTVGAYIYKGTDITAEPYMASEVSSVDKKDYQIYGSTVDNKLKFAQIALGEYTYVIKASTVNHSANENVLATETITKRLHQNTFAVTSTLPCTHSYAGQVTTVASCGEDGLITYTCTKCKYVYKETTFSEGSHNIGDWVTIQEPTCTEEGVQERGCANCSLTESETIVAKGHNYEAETLLPDCTQQGYTTYTCSDCGDSYQGDYTEPVGHKEISADRIDATCTQSGVTEGVFCETCGEILSGQAHIPPMGHQEISETVEPDCTNQGYTQITCERCGESCREDYVEANGHSYEATVTPPEPGKQGYTTHTCTACGDSYVDSYTEALPPEETEPEMTETEETEPEATEPSLPAGEAELKFTGASLTLGSDLTVNFAVNSKVFDNGAYTNPRVEFVIKDVKTGKLHRSVVTKYTVTDNGTRMRFHFEGISPRMMKGEIQATLYGTYHGVEYSESKTYSAAEYCYNQLRKSEDAKLRVLVVDLLNYGTAHQIYKNYDLANPINGELTPEQKLLASNHTLNPRSILNEEYVKTESASAAFNSVALALNNAVEVRFKITCEDLTDVSVRAEVDNEVYIVDAKDFERIKDNQYYVYIKQLKAKQMRSDIYATVYRGDTKISNTILYSIETYVARMANGDDSLSNLLRMMLYYGDSAATYFNK